MISGEVYQVAKRRRIVPDPSVILPAFFRERMQCGEAYVDLSRRAQSIADAIRVHTVKAFAPAVFPIEFMTGAHRKCSTRDSGPEIQPEPVKRRFIDFLSLPIVLVPPPELATRAWDLVCDCGVSPPDSWYLACAISCQAELWISHSHGDGFAEQARKVWRRVYLLTDTRFDDVTV